VEGGGWAQGTTEPQKFQSLFVADMMGHLGYSVVNVGPPDLAYGLEVLRQTAVKNKFELVSSNIRRKSDGKLVFKPYVIRDVKGVRVAFLGVVPVDQTLSTATTEVDDLVVDEPLECVRKLLLEVKAKADVVVVFSHLSQRKTQQLLDEVKGIDVAVSGGDGFINQKVTVVGTDSTGGKSLMLEAGERGKYLGALSLVVSEHGKILRHTNTIHTMDKNIKDDSTVVALVEDFKSKLREVRKKEAVEQVVGAGASSTQSTAPQEKFLGAQVCGRCHQEALNAWKASTHATSMAVLEGKSMEASAECLKCHVTGYNMTNGYQANMPAELGSVSCEQCHGYGTQHGDKTFQAKPAAQSCTVCHDKKNSPKFEYESYWARIKH